MHVSFIRSKSSIVITAAFLLVEVTLALSSLWYYLTGGLEEPKDFAEAALGTLTGCYSERKLVLDPNPLLSDIKLFLNYQLETFAFKFK